MVDELFRRILIRRPCCEGILKRRERSLRNDVDGLFFLFFVRLARLASEQSPNHLGKVAQKRVDGVSNFAAVKQERKQHEYPDHHEVDELWDRWQLQVS